MGHWYQRYLASREWAIRREAVRKRCEGVCERCKKADMEQVHHLTYVNVGNERLEELQGLCEPCHLFVSGKTDKDPLVDPIASLITFQCPECCSRGWDGKQQNAMFLTCECGGVALLCRFKSFPSARFPVVDPIIAIEHAESIASALTIPLELTTSPGDLIYENQPCVGLLFYPKRRP